MSGKLYPNTTQVPNVFLDKVMKLLPAAPLKVLLTIARFTYGFQKESDKIGNRQLCDKTGLSRRSVIRGVQDLGELITVKQGGPGKGPNEYSLNLDVSDATIEAIKRRLLASGSATSGTSVATGTSAISGKQVVPPVAPIQTKYSKPNNSARQRTARKHPEETDPRVQTLIAAFCSKYLTRTGGAYVLVRGKDPALLKRLLAAGKETSAVEAAMDRYFANDFYSKAGFDVGGFVKAFNRLSSAGAKARHNYENGAYPEMAQ